MEGGSSNKGKDRELEVGQASAIAVNRGKFTMCVCSRSKIEKKKRTVFSGLTWLEWMLVGSDGGGECC